VSLWSAAALFFTGPKKQFLSIQMLISCNSHGGNFWNFFHMFSSEHTRISYSYMCPKMFFFKKLVLVPKMAVLEHFWWKHSQGTLRVNDFEFQNFLFNTKLIIFAPNFDYKKFTYTQIYVCIYIYIFVEIFTYKISFSSIFRKNTIFKNVDKQLK